MANSREDDTRTVLDELRDGARFEIRQRLGEGGIQADEHASAVDRNDRRTRLVRARQRVPSSTDPESAPDAADDVAARLPRDAIRETAADRETLLVLHVPVDASHHVGLRARDHSL